MLSWIQNWFDKLAIRRRVATHFDMFNRADWSGCQALIDPTLRINPVNFHHNMVRFRDQCRSRHLISMKISLHDSAKSDPRPFACVHVVWEDPEGKQWTEQERWVKHYGSWYTRSTGMIWNERN